MMRLKGLSVILALALFASSSWAQSPHHVLVSLFDAVSTKPQITLHTPVQVLQNGGSAGVILNPPLVARCHGTTVQVVQQQPAKGERIMASGTRLILSRENHAPIGLSVHKASGEKGPRRYVGSIQLQSAPAGTSCSLKLENQVPLFNYLTSVISSETGSGWPKEALKAQAILTQTRLATTSKKVLSDTTQDELYLGEGRVRPEAREAVQAVWHQVLTYQNRPIPVYYHAACGGHTTDLSWFNPTSRTHAPYLQGKPCPYCKKSPFGRPTVSTLDKARFIRTFHTERPSIQQADAGGHPMQIALGNQALSGYKFWLKLGQSFGWDKIPGSRFSFVPSKDSQTLQVQSVGAGHGIGLCQWGAAEMAKQGKTVQDILAFYFNQTTISSW